MAKKEKVVELTKKEFETFIGKGTSVVDFFADWCMPCLMMAPITEELAEKFHGKVRFGKINVDENQELAKKFRIMSIPNFVVFKDGEKIDQIIGAMSAEDFEEKLKKNI